MITTNLEFYTQGKYPSETNQEISMYPYKDLGVNVHAALFSGRSKNKPVLLTDSFLSLNEIRERSAESERKGHGWV